MAAVVGLALSVGCSSGNGSDATSATKVVPPTTTTTTTTTVPVPPKPAPAAWSPCPDVGPKVECATIKVPLDYTHPTVDTISLAISRIKATGARVGVLVFNPGGPGGSGLDMPATMVDEAASRAADAAMLSRFDLIGFDPRGVGKSTPFDCGDLDAIDHADYSPDDAAELAALKKTMKSFAHACQTTSGRLLPFLGTESAARDVDQIRQALGERQVNLLGFSYGTELFGTYVDLFPANVRAAVLDGALPSGDTGVGQFKKQALNLEVQLQDFFDTCAKQPECAIAKGGSPGENFDHIFATVDAHPLVIDGGETITASQGKTVVATTLFSAAARPFLEVGLANAAKGDGSTVKVGWDFYAEIEGGRQGNTDAVGVAINCMDHTWPAPDVMFDQVAIKLPKEAPRIGEAFSREYLACAYWPAKAAKERVRHAAGSPPIVVIGTTADPSTPYRGAQVLAKQLDNGVLLTRTGIGHTAMNHSTCINDAVAEYLLTVSPPPTGTVCPTDE